MPIELTHRVVRSGRIMTMATRSENCWVRQTMGDPRGIPSYDLFGHCVLDSEAQVLVFFPRLRSEMRSRSAFDGLRGGTGEGDGFARQFLVRGVRRFARQFLAGIPGKVMPWLDGSIPPVEGFVRIVRIRALGRPVAHNG